MGAEIKRVGILTGGGDCPGLNAVIRAVGKSLINSRDIELVGVMEGYLGLVKDITRPLVYSDLSDIIHIGGTILGSSNKDDPFAFVEEEGGKKVKKDLSAQAFTNYKKHKLDALAVIGGDGSMFIADKLAKIGMNIVGVPKTIDNDLYGTDITFGFSTAVQTVVDALDKIRTTAASHHRCFVVETMGRYAGWIALYSGIASGADCVLLPEIPFDVEHVSELIDKRYKGGKRSSLVVVAEGAYPKGGERVVDKVVEDSPEPIRLGGIAKYLAERIETHTGRETRSITLGHIQRGGSPVAFDRRLGTLYGTAAAELILKGEFGKMVTLKGSETSSIALSEVAGKTRIVPADHPMIKAGKSIGVIFGE